MVHFYLCIARSNVEHDDDPAQHCFSSNFKIVPLVKLWVRPRQLLERYIQLTLFKVYMSVVIVQLATLG